MTHPTYDKLPAEVLPLSKIMNMPKDFGELPRSQQFVRGVADLLAGQHIARVWEYSMAVTAILRWETNQIAGEPLQILDAGGAGSNFWKVLIAFTSEDIVRVDPNFPVVLDREPGGDFAGQQSVYRRTLEDYALTQRMAERFDVLTAISVIEHIPDTAATIGQPTPLGRFLTAAHALLRPGGLLVLTTDYWDTDGPDTAHFHWMRERIYNRESLHRLDQRILDLGFARFGTCDRTWHGPQLYDYAMASSCFQKEG